jgi:ribose transport system permease protein
MAQQDGSAPPISSPGDRAESGVSSASTNKSTRRRLDFGGDKYALAFVWLALAVLFSVLRPETFATWDNVRTIFSSQSVLVILALAALLPLIVGEFDLSIAANLGLCAIIVATLDVKYDWPIAAAVLVAVLVGAIVGALNAILVVGVGVDALVATLGVATLATGTSLAVSDYLTVSGVDPVLTRAINTQIGGMPLSFFYGLVLAAVLWIVLSRTALGRHLYFVGQSREVARLSGLRTAALRSGAFITAGVLAGVAGVVLTGTLGSADPAVGASFLLPAYAAAFLGSTTIRPGFFNPGGTLLAVYFLATGIVGLQLLGLEDWVQQFFYGLSLIFAVTLSRLVGRRRRSRA